MFLFSDHYSQPRLSHRYLVDPKLQSQQQLSLKQANQEVFWMTPIPHFRKFQPQWWWKACKRQQWKLEMNKHYMLINIRHVSHSPRKFVVSHNKPFPYYNYSWTDLPILNMYTCVKKSLASVILLCKNMQFPCSASWGDKCLSCGGYYSTLRSHPLKGEYITIYQRIIYFSKISISKESHHVKSLKLPFSLIKLKVILS